MKITTSAIKDGKLDEKYGCRGTDFVEGDMPSRSFPFEIHDAPEGTVSYAIVFDDPDSTPLCGFAWVHWLAVGITDTMIPENASQTDKKMVQGYNDWYLHGVNDKLRASYYGGPYPPDKEHEYVLTVLALDFIPSLKPGYSHEELKACIDGHVLAEAVIKGRYWPKN